MIVALLLLACAQPGPWTAQTALAPTLVRLDTNHDGRVTAEEYAAVAFPSAPFERVDTDGDGALSVEELSDLLLAQRPDDFFAAPRLPRGTPMQPAADAEIHMTVAWQTLESLREEVAAATPAAALPSPAEVDRAAQAGLGSPEGIAMMKDLRGAYGAAGLRFPEPARPSP